MSSSFSPKYPTKIKSPEYETTHQAWDKLPDESDKAFEAFLVYRNMEIGRTLERVSERVYGEKWESGLRYIEDWVKLYSWERRSLAYDAFIHDNEHQMVDKAVRKARLQIVDKLEELTSVALDGALGKKKVTREQAGLIMSFMDRVGPGKQQPKVETNILNQVQVMAPELPRAISSDFTALPSAIGEIDKTLTELIPEDLRRK